MTFRRLGRAALLGVALVGARGLAAPPAPLNLPPANVNQALADQIAGQLRQSALLRNYSVDVAARGGDVELRGVVADQAQREEVLRLVQGVPGVGRVIDQITMATPARGIVPVQAPAIPPKLPDATPGGSEKKEGGDAKPNGGMLPEPAPLGPSPLGAIGQQNPPRMPPYAWPTYAPHNNYARVGYPNAYPWQAWPFIGPIYPFPKVPLGWRSVKLEFDDGYWWYGQVGNKYNWWKLRYW